MIQQSRIGGNSKVKHFEQRIQRSLGVLPTETLMGVSVDESFWNSKTILMKSMKQHSPIHIDAKLHRG